MILFAALTPFAARADCSLQFSSKTYLEGQFVYNADHKVMQVCDGTNWRAALAGGGSVLPTLENLGDTNIPAPGDGEVLTYDSGSGKWVAGTAGIGAETDPQVGTLTEGKWCYVSGGVIDCTQDAPGGGGVPSGAVMAFNLGACPSGWSEYTLAKGRFVRGVCLDGTGCNDPDGVRAVGSTQADEYEDHNHSYTRYGSLAARAAGGGGNWNRNTSLQNTSSSGGNETRPVNVALLYCEKD